MLASLRWRMVLLSAASILLALAAASIALRWTFEHYLEERYARELDVKIGEILAAFRIEGDEPKVVGALSDARYEQPLSGVYWQISTEGAPVLQSRSLWDQTLGASSANEASDGSYEVRWPDGAVLYAMHRDVVLVDSAGAPKPYRLTVAIDHAEIDATDAAFIHDAWLALGGIGLALLFGAWLQIEIGLRPLRQLRDRVAAIRDGRAARLEGGMPTEVLPLVEEFNALLQRQAEALRRSRERAGSLAHGLKTPITILYGEADRLDDRGLADDARLLKTHLAAMSRHVGRELARARSHGSAAPGELYTDARRSADRLIGLVKRMPRGQELTFLNNLPEGLSLQIDPDDFGEVLGNLLDNARKYAESRVEISARLLGPRARIIVADDGPGISANLREWLTQRGERADNEVEGSGVGFSIVRDLLADYNATIEFGEREGRGCEIGFSLPTSAKASSSNQKMSRQRSGAESA